MSAEQSAHARRSLRLSADEVVTLFDGRGHESTGRIVSADPAGLQVAVEQVRFWARATPVLNLAVALPKGPRQDVLIEKCTELGVAAVLPLHTARSLRDASPHKLGKWQRTAIEAAKQSRQCWLPVFQEPRTLSEVLEDRASFDLVSAAALPRGDSGPAGPIVTDVLPRLAAAKNMLALVGPEGGWSEEEMQQLTAAGVLCVSLGPNVLRVETAAIVLAALVHSVRTNQGAPAAPLVRGD